MMPSRLTPSTTEPVTITEAQVREDLRPGNKFPDFSLPDTSGEVVQLSELMDGWPTMLVFERGKY